MPGPERLPIFEETVAAFRADPVGRHHWRTHPDEPVDPPTEEVHVPQQYRRLPSPTRRAR